jgi:glycosyltransferase involved in cell wall biosynthesis
VLTCWRLPDPSLPYADPVTPIRVPECADALERVARDSDLAQRLGRAARQKIETGFSSTRNAALMVDLIRSTTA